MRARNRAIVSEIGALALLLAAALGVFWRILFTGDAWKPAGGGDLASFLYPVYRFASAQLRAGDLPLWNPHLYGGAPFLADMQTGLFYPLNLLLFLLAPNFGYKAMEWLVVFHVFLAGLFMYLCLRFFEPGRHLRMPAALLGAVAYMFSDLFVVHFGNLNLVAVAAWLPLVVLLFWRAIRTRRLGLAVGAGVALGISTLEGHLQITLYIGLALAVLAAVDALAARREPRDRAWSLLALAVTAAVAVGLSALVLLPAFEYARLSPRAELSYWDAARYSLIPGLLGEMLVPALFSSREPALYWGVWDRVAVGYIGILPLILAGLALLLRRGPKVRPFVVLAGVAFLLALGGESVFHGWAYRLLPGFGQIRAPARLILLVDFGLAALAALGLDRLLLPLDRRDRKALEGAWRWLLWFGSGAILLGGAWAYTMIYQAQDRDPTLFWRVSAAGSGLVFCLLMLAAALAWLGARRAGRLPRTTWAWLAVGLVFVDLASLGAHADLGREAPIAGYDHPQVVQFLTSDPDLFRIDSRTDVWGAWQPNLALLAGLYDVSGVDNPLMVGDVARYYDGIGDRSSALYDFLGVRYVLGSKDVVLDEAKFSLAFDQDAEVNVYHNQRALPRAFVVTRAVQADSHEAAWDRIHEAGFDPATTVVVEGGQALDGSADAQGTVRVVDYGSDRVSLEVESPAQGYLVLSDPYYPGWQATVDGEKATIVRANYAFRAVAVEPGTHRVDMVYRPTSWSVGLGITLATALALLIVGATALGRRRRENRPAS